MTAYVSKRKLTAISAQESSKDEKKEKKVKKDLCSLINVHALNTYMH